MTVTLRGSSDYTMHSSECETEFQRVMIDALVDAWESLYRTIPFLHPAKTLFGAQLRLAQRRKQAKDVLWSKMRHQSK